MPKNPSSDEHIMQMMESNKEVAFSLLVDAYAQKIWVVCHSILSSKEDAEDVSQEVFTAVFNSIDTFKGESQLTTWIHAIAINKCKEHLRKKNRKKRFGFLTAFKESESSHFVSDFDANQIEQKEEIQVVRTAIQQLPENQRLVYSLVKLEEYNYKEVEEMTGFTKSAIESLMFRAKSKLVDLLSDYYNQHYK